MTYTVTLYNPQQGHAAITEIWPKVKAYLMGGNRLTLCIKKETRSSEQNRLLHALLQETASDSEWAGARRDVETWKRLFVASWCRARGEHVEMLPALDGMGVDIVFRRTSQMTKDELSELIEYIESWRANK